MNVLPYEEIPTVAIVRSMEELDRDAYMAANPDLRAARVDPQDHYRRYGMAEKRLQFVNASRIAELRHRKLRELSFKRRLRVDTGPVRALSRAVMDRLEIPEFPPVAANEYNPELVDLIRKNPGRLFLDVGAGLRHVYRSNVVNAEIWPSPSTDVVCVGEDLPFSDNQFDHVLCLAVLEHTKRPWIAVQEIIRVTKPGGFIRIDWPFLQPVHGYPHHFFNATPKGVVSQFEDQCDIIKSEVRPWQHPIFTLFWMLRDWRAGLPDSRRAEFDQLSVGQILQTGYAQHLASPYCEQLSVETQRMICAGTTLIASKR